MKPKPKLSALRRRELAQDARQRARRGFVGIAPLPVIHYSSRLERARERERMLVAYAVALAEKRGVLTAVEANRMQAMIFEADREAGTALVTFTEYDEVQGRRGPELRPRGEPSARIELRNLDWVPAQPVEELIGDVAKKGVTENVHA